MGGSRIVSSLSGSSRASASSADVLRARSVRPSREEFLKINIRVRRDERRGYEAKEKKKNIRYPIRPGFFFPPDASTSFSFFFFPVILSRSESCAVGISLSLSLSFSLVI